MPAWADVKLDRVVHGSASISGHAGQTLIRAGDNAILQFHQFDVDRGESVRFRQPSASSRLLGRVNSAVPSQIDGAIHANGHVYLLNPSGIVFGHNAQVRTRGFTAAAAHMSDADFLAGRDRFTSGIGDVVNFGQLTGDTIQLVGHHVENHGTILATDLVVMAAGDDVFIGERNGKILVGSRWGRGG